MFLLLTLLNMQSLYFFSRVFYLLLKENSSDIFEVKKQITQSMTLIYGLLNTGKIIINIIKRCMLSILKLVSRKYKLNEVLEQQAKCHLSLSA